MLRCFRRQGISEAMARGQTFDTFRGFWQVMQIAENHAAIAFWRKVIGDYTGGNYREFHDIGGGGQRQLWQTFDTGATRRAVETFRQGLRERSNEAIPGFKRRVANGARMDRATQRQPPSARIILIGLGVLFLLMQMSF